HLPTAEEEGEAPKQAAPSQSEGCRTRQCPRNSVRGLGALDGPSGRDLERWSARAEPGGKHVPLIPVQARLRRTPDDKRRTLRHWHVTRLARRNRVPHCP